MRAAFPFRRETPSLRLWLPLPGLAAPPPQTLPPGRPSPPAGPSLLAGPSPGGSDFLEHCGDRVAHLSIARPSPPLRAPGPPYLWRESQPECNARRIY